jgi:hypothetical protein
VLVVDVGLVVVVGVVFVFVGEVGVGLVVDVGVVVVLVVVEAGVVVVSSEVVKK